MTAPNHSDRVRYSGRRPAMIILAVLLLLAIWLLFGPLRTLANANSGFIAAIGIFVVVPLAILSNRLLEKARRKQLAATTANLLAYELWHNISYVGQIEESYENNLEWFEATKQPTGVHVPHLGPRISVLEKFITVENLLSLDEPRARQLLEIYAQLCALQEEFPTWKARLPAALENRELYEAYSSTILAIIDPLMRNMIDMWVRLLGTSKFVPQIPEIASAVSLIRSRILQGQILRPTYKSSYFKTHRTDFAPNEKIVSWRNDWKDAPVEVIDLSVVSLFAEVENVEQG